MKPGRYGWRVLRRLALIVAPLLVACSTEPGASVGSKRVVTTRSGSAATIAGPRTAATLAEPVATTVATTTPRTTVPSVPTTAPAGPGLGDPLLPELGNPGIDVTHYALDLRFDRGTRILAGAVTLSITAQADLPSFTLDSPAVDKVTVDGTVARTRYAGPKLVITPDRPIAKGATFTVVATYSLDTGADPPRPGLGSDSAGWFLSDNGSYVLNEPDGARTWMPSNDHPSDKATWDFTFTVPKGVSAIANGTKVGHETTAAGEVWRWKESAPMATYLVQVLTGEYEIVEGQAPGGPKLLSVAIPSAASNLRPCHDLTIRQLEYFGKLVGPYPFENYGLALSDMFGGLAMEDQERSLFSAGDLGDCTGYSAQLLTSHELAHQWFGDAVTLARWDDIWLNESFATYLQWLWFDHAGLTPIEQSAEWGREGRTDRPTGKPTLEDMFGMNSYDGGAVVLHALRGTVGDAKFFEILRRWHTDNRGQSRRTADFIALAEQVSGRDLDKFFGEWLFAAKVPDRYPQPAVAATTVTPTTVSTGPTTSTSTP